MDASDQLEDERARLHPWSHTWIGTDRWLARRVARPMARFLEIEAASGVLLLIATAIALVWVNSPWKGSYASFLEAEFLIELGPVHLELTLQEFVNDGLMALFFFVAGLEIKREFVKGELRDRRAAALPVIAALGGMIVPALLYFVINAGTPTSNGWGIPMATDIAFAVGIVSLLGKRVPVALKLFLLTLAVADDLGAIAVIAVFYSQGVRFVWLGAAVLVLAIVYLLRRRHVWYLPVYVALGILAWYFMLRSGVHATVAGVALGFLTPTDPLRDDLSADRIVDRLEDAEELSAGDVQAASFLIRESVPVGERFANRLLPWTSYVIIPIFALVNAGVPLTSSALEAARSSNVTWGVFIGLVVGKTVGIFAAAMIAIRIGVARMPRGATALHMVGISMAAGIGFTVALFVTGLAFTELASIDEAKVGILVASLVAGVGSAVILRIAASRSSDAELALEAQENEEFFAESDDVIL